MFTFQWNLPPSHNILVSIALVLLIRLGRLLLLIWWRGVRRSHTGTPAALGLWSVILEGGGVKLDNLWNKKKQKQNQLCWLAFGKHTRVIINKTNKAQASHFCSTASYYSSVVKRRMQNTDVKVLITNWIATKPPTWGNGCPTGTGKLLR